MSNLLPAVPPLFTIRGCQVVLDADLAELFGVPTKRLNEQVRRNPDRFPEQFAFRLSTSETAALRSQIATSNTGRGGTRYRPLAYSEHGVVMAATVLNSARAVAMSVEVVKAFVRYRKALRDGLQIKQKLDQLEAAVKARLDNHDAEIARLFETLESLLERDVLPTGKKRIGFLS